MIASLKFLVPVALIAHAVSRIAPRASAVSTSAPAWPVGFDNLMNPVASAHVQAGWGLHVSSGLFLAVWLMGSAAVLFRWYLRWRRAAIAIRNSEAIGWPGVFGILRPRLVLPEVLRTQLTGEQLDAIIAHELCHIRRRDNLLSAIHMAVEAAFWFFPVVWWIGARLIEERELACDEEVVRLGYKPEVYAQGILQVCKLCLEVPVDCISGVTGSNLRGRVERIMRNQFVDELGFWRKILLTAAGVAGIAWPVGVGIMHAPVLYAQAAASPKLAFEVASIKASEPGSLTVHMAVSPGGALNFEGTVKLLLQMAFRLQEYQISGAPAWTGSQKYVIAAKAPEGATKSEAVPMMQTLLADRFGLAYHRESREIPIYALVLAGGESRLHPSELPNCEGVKVSPCGGFRVSPAGFLDGHRVELPLLVQQLEFLLGRRVVDRTGLAGFFDINLRWTPDQPMSIRPGEPSLPADPNIPSIYTAIQEQLGLKLEPRKGPVEFLVVDRIERPVPQ